VSTLPYATSGNTRDFNGWYDEHCETSADAPEVVYAYTPSVDEVVNISLCDNSAFDTKLYVYENVEGNTVACNDDACTTGMSRLDTESTSNWPSPGYTNTTSTTTTPTTR